MAAISNNNIALAVYEMLKGKSAKEQAEAVPKVVEFLNRKRLLSKSKDILTRLEKILNQAEGKLEVRTYSADKLSESHKKELAQALSKRYGGREMIFKEQIDERLLGGVRIEINDEVIDLSIRNKIKKLKEHLTKRQ
ncbi:MAG: ATP synthase F1 subunit delta [Candidatus Paceibacterota bacterium]|jgi:F-type H+-transporting ATPase subunit delta